MAGKKLQTYSDLQPSPIKLVPDRAKDWDQGN
jgi:hypothetical protein